MEKEYGVNPNAIYYDEGDDQEPQDFQQRYEEYLDRIENQQQKEK